MAHGGIVTPESRQVTLLSLQVTVAAFRIRSAMPKKFAVTASGSICLELRYGSTRLAGTSVTLTAFNELHHFSTKIDRSTSQ
jgi:hypothetical protein